MMLHWDNNNTTWWCTHAVIYSVPDVSTEALSVSSGGWVDSIECLFHFHQLRRQCHSCLRLYIVGLHLLRRQRHRDISDDRWLIQNERCCQRWLHLVSSLDVGIIERFVGFLHQQWREYSSLCRWEHHLDDSIDLIDILVLDHQQSLCYCLHQSAIRQYDDSTSRQWQYFDYHHRYLIHSDTRVDWCHHYTHFYQPLSLLSVTIVHSSIEWACLQWREVILLLCRGQLHLDRENLHPVSGHFCGIVHSRIINWRDNSASLEIDETPCHNLLEKCLRGIGTLFKRHIKKYCSMKVKIYSQSSKYTYWLFFRIIITEHLY